MAETGGGDSAGELPKEGDAAAVHGWRGELKQLMLVAGPMIFVNLFVMAIQLISVMFVGHLGELALSRSTIATSFSNVVGISVVTGMSTALDTLCGQAYGAKKYRLVGLYLQQSLIVLNLSSIPFVFIFAYVGDILQWLRQDPEIAIGAGEYARCLIPALFGLATSQSHTRFLLAQSLVVPTFFCAFATLACHIPLCWVLVYRSSLGFQGAAVATSISNWINALLLTSYVRFSKACQKTRTSLTWEAFHDLKYFLQLAIPSAGMICLEWWCYELLVLVAGLLPNPVLQASTLSICMNTAAMHFQIPFGIGAGVSTRVSNELGAGRSQTARTAVKVALCVALSEAIIMSIILISTHNLVGRIYSNDQDVISYVSMIVPMLSVSVFFDSTQATLSGAARGCGFQKFGACINLGAYYFVGLPIGCVLAFRTSLEGQGLWVTALCASFVQSTCFAILVSTINWDKQVLKAAARLDASGEPLLA